jgi:hypothetical protein
MLPNITERNEILSMGGQGGAKAETETVLPLILTYGNGHSPTPTELKMDIEASFAWRIHHAHFLDRYPHVFSSVTSTRLPKNISELKISDAIKAIRVDQDIHGRLILVLGIDDYHVIRRLPRRFEDQSTLATLLDVLVGTMQDSENGIIPLLTGTTFVPLSGSSGSMGQYVPLKLLSMKEVVTAVRTIPMLTEMSYSHTRQPIDI